MRRISISQDDTWAGDGSLTRHDDGTVTIYDCPAILGPDHLDHESGAQQEYSERVYEAIEEAIAVGQECLTMDGIEYTWAITKPEIEVVGLGDDDWTTDNDREWQRYGTVLVRIGGIEYEVGAAIGVPEHLIGTAKAAGGDTHTPYLAAWYEYPGDWSSARRVTTGTSEGIPARLEWDVIGAINEAVRQLWQEHMDAIAAEVQA